MGGGTYVLVSVRTGELVGVGGMTRMGGAGTGLHAERIKMRKIMDNTLCLCTFPPG